MRTLLPRRAFSSGMRATIAQSPFCLRLQRPFIYPVRRSHESPPVSAVASREPEDYVARWQVRCLQQVQFLDATRQRIQKTAATTPSIG